MSRPDSATAFSGAALSEHLKWLSVDQGCDSQSWKLLPRLQSLQSLETLELVFDAACPLRPGVFSQVDGEKCTFNTLKLACNGDIAKVIQSIVYDRTSAFPRVKALHIEEVLGSDADKFWMPTLGLGFVFPNLYEIRVKGKGDTDYRCVTRTMKSQGVFEFHEVDREPKVAWRWQLSPSARE